MPLMLSDEECAVLRQALDYYLPQIRMVRAHAEAREAQHEISLLETALEVIRERLEHVPAVIRPSGTPLH